MRWWVGEMGMGSSFEVMATKEMQVIIMMMVAIIFFIGALHFSNRKVR
jgi:hypothetical protein